MLYAIYTVRTATAARAVPHEDPTTYATRIIKALHLKTADATVEALERVRTDAGFRTVLIGWYEERSGERDEGVLKEWMAKTLGMEKELVL